ncbi:MAG: transcription-repair coupling factor [Vicinamibacteria bacterium]|nr:transcription-repair coupling factor [Vicinamibacteria bacterium]
MSARAAWLARLDGAAWLQQARSRLAADGVIALHGIADAAAPLAAALLAEGDEQRPSQPLLLVVPRERDVEGVAADLRTLLGELGREGDVLGFPAPGPAPYRGLARHPEALLRRAAALHAAQRGTLAGLVASPAGLLRPSLRRELFETRAFSLATGEEMTPEILLEALDEAGYVREDPVTAPGQVARRGGIVDFFPPDREDPVRLEFLGDTIETLRGFDPETQRSREHLRRLDVLPLSDVFPTRSLLQALPARIEERFPPSRERDALLEKLHRGLFPDDLPELLSLVAGALVAPWTLLPPMLTVLIEPEQLAEETEAFVARAREEWERHEDALWPGPEEALCAPEVLQERLATGPRVEVRALDLDARGVRVGSRPAPRYAGDLRRLADELPQREATVLFLGNAGRAERVADVLREAGVAVAEGGRVDVRTGVLSAGFELESPPLRVLADGDVFPEEVHVHARARGRRARGFLSDFRDLKVGDLVVHDEHGIGRFVGLETLQLGGQTREFMVLAYQGGDKLKVPVDAFDRVQKYASAEGARPNVDKLGSGSWEKVKKRVKKAMRDMAAELLRLYALRKAQPGHAFTAEGPWQREFEDAFEWEETVDQAAAIGEVENDMAQPSPMDRLVCGDVGYGKTEVAMRAAMRCVLDGKQVAVLAPTTVLAFQHWKTFRKRFSPFPVAVDMVSRFRSPAEVKRTLALLADGKVDILIGTHRLLSKDVVWKDLGLLVIDEEQRFGVAAKEKLKQLKTAIDCLTLSATPIPRTLQMGLSGLRDMSVIETPPKDRLAIHTSIVKFSTQAIAAAIRQELSRDGQVYLVHNRVESIYALAGLVQRLVPEARVAVAHGQLPESQLEKQMLSFVEGRADVLVATTIIENGLDIPRANTLIVNRADRYGLAQLYQLRGRVGRSDRRAYAYLLVPPDTALSEIAKKRLAAIQEFSDLGAGFRIAALDLELRGAGNLLGGAQSGHIEAVGLDLYLKLLDQTILELRGQVAPETLRTALNLGLDLRVPPEYVPDVNQRMAFYKRASQARDLRELDALRAEVRERYGAPPPEADALLRYAGLRARAEALGLRQVDRTAHGLALLFGERPPLPVDDLVALVRAQPGAALLPQGGLRLPVAAGREPMDALEATLLALEQGVSAWRGRTMAGSP